MVSVHSIRIFLFAVFMQLALQSCVVVPVGGGPDFEKLPDKYSRLIVYLHLEGGTGADTVFSLNDLTLVGQSLDENAGDVIHKVISTPMEISSSRLEDGQVKVGEIIVTPGKYDSLKLSYSDARIEKAGGSVVSLDVGEGSINLEEALTLENKESRVLLLGWNARSSRVKGTNFDPDIKIVKKGPVSKDIAVFVSNSGSNYITVIDRDLQMVVGAVTVGRGPMGMALNYSSGYLYVVNSVDSTVSVLNMQNYEVLSTIDVSAYSPNPIECVYVPSDVNTFEGKVFVIGDSSEVAVIDTESASTIGIIDAGIRPVSIVVDGTRKELYVASKVSRAVGILSAVTDRESEVINLPQSPSGLALWGDNIYAFSAEGGSIVVVSKSSRSVVKNLFPLVITDRGIVTDDGEIYGIGKDSGKVSVLDDFGNSIAEIETGREPTFAAWDGLNRMVYVVNSGDNSVSIVDTIKRSLVVSLDVGSRPYAVAVSGEYGEK